MTDIPKPELPDFPKAHTFGSIMLTALETYAASYDTIAKMGDGQVQARSVAEDIRRNMITAVRAALIEERRTLLAETKELGNLLAVLHADGGHNQTEHGTQKAVADAMTKYYDMHLKIDRLETVVKDDNGAHLSWAVDRWNAEVKNRPLVNVHRRTLDDTWRQVMRRFGGDPDVLVGPSHDELLSRAKS